MKSIQSYQNTSQQWLVQNHYLKNQNNAWNLSKVTNKNTTLRRRTWLCSGASVFGFQQRNVGLDNDHHFRIIYRSLESYSLQDIRSCKKKHENSCKRQKHPSGSDFIKRCSENMLQIYRRTHMQFCWNCTSARVFSCKFSVYFQSTFS